MDSAEAQDFQVKEDIRNLTRILNADNLNPDLMFSAKRGIRSCRRMAAFPSGGPSVIERLKRVPVPE
jgi:hypothetical protein